MQRYSMLNAVQNKYPTIDFKYVCKAIPDYLHPNNEALSASEIQCYLERKELSPESVIEQYKTRKILYITGTKDNQTYLDNMDAFELNVKELCGDNCNETKLFYKLDGAGHSEPSLTKSEMVKEFLWGENSEENNKPNPEASVTEQLTNINIYTHGKTIVVENATDDIFVYDAMEKLVGRDVARNVSTITVNDSGIYIVKNGTLSKKIFVE